MVSADTKAGAPVPEVVDAPPPQELGDASRERDEPPCCRVASPDRTYLTAARSNVQMMVKMPTPHTCTTLHTPFVLDTRKVSAPASPNTKYPNAAHAARPTHTFQEPQQSALQKPFVHNQTASQPRKSP